MRKLLVLLFICNFLIILTCAISGAEGEAGMKISSPDFKDNEYMPRKLTCDAQGVSPALIIEGLPAQAKSLALIVDDPDAPAGTFVHWVVFDIGFTQRIEENSVPGKQGQNDSGRNEYGGPCPPSGTHRYFFKIYALDIKLNLNAGITKQELEKAMAGHILGQAELIGLYKKTR